MKVIVKNARLSFSDLFKPKSIGASEPKFTATAICLNGDESGNPDGLKTTVTYTNSEGEKVTKPYSTLSTICEHVLKEKFGKVPAKAKNWGFNKADGSTTRDQFVNGDGDYYAGFGDDTYYISASKKADMCKDEKLTVLDQHKSPISANSGLIFSGCFVNLVLDVYAYAGEEGSGVTISLEGIQLKKKGEPLGITQIDAADEFDEEDFDEDEDDASDLL